MRIRCNRCENYADFKIDEEYVCRHCYIDAIMKYEDKDAKILESVDKPKAYNVLMGVK